MTRRDRGAALVLVLGAVALLTVLAVELASRASADALRAIRASRDATFRRIYESGVAIARALILEASSGAADHWGEAWNREVTFKLGAEERGTVRVFDENGKLNVGRIYTRPEEAEAIRAQVGRLFDYLERRSRSEGMDWKDVRDKVLRRLHAAVPLYSLDGLREAGVEAFEILSPYLTCFGDGLINLNTAPRAVLYAIDPEVDEMMADRIASYRGGREGEVGRYRPFEDSQDLMLVDGIVTRTLHPDGSFRVTRNLYEKLQGRICVRSSCFSARVAASIGEKSRVAWAFVKPDGARVGFEEVLP